MQYSFETAICLEKSCSVALPIAMVHRKEWHIRSGYQATSNSHISSKQVNSPRPCKSKHTAAAEQTWQLRNARLLYHIFRWGSFSNRRSYSIARWSHRCPFPIDWLINRGVSSEAPLTTGFYDDRWDEPVTGPPIFTKRTYKLGGLFSFVSTSSLRRPVRFFFVSAFARVAARDYLNPPAEPEPESAGAAKLERSVAGIDGKK